MPNADQALVDIRKLRDYCLSLNHPRGRHKARVFQSLGFSSANAEQLRGILLDAAMSPDATVGLRDAYGQRYSVDTQINGPFGSAVVRSSWIVRPAEGSPRLISCYVV